MQSSKKKGLLQGSVSINLGNSLHHPYCKHTLDAEKD